MKFIPTPLKDAYVIELVPFGDERGFFAATFEDRAFRDHGITSNFVRAALSFNAKRGTLRGMHFQVKPHEEAKLVRCTRGAMFDAIIDLRPDSPTYKKSYGIELTADNRLGLFVPEGFAHGYLTLTDNAEFFYQLGDYYSPAHYQGVRWNDPAFGIKWPFEPAVIADRDANYPLFP